MNNKTNKKLLWQLPFLALLIIGSIFIIKQQRSTPYQHNEGEVFWYVLPHNISKRTGLTERNRSGIKESGQLVVYL